MSFTDILTMGSIKEKAMYSFKLLDNSNKGYITEDDVSRMMTSVFEVWNIMTNSKVVMLPEYVKEVYRQLDRDGDGTLDFDEYQKMYMRDKIVFGWYEYLNQDEYFIKQMLNRGNTNLDAVSPQLNLKLDDIKNEIGEAMKMILDIENKSAMNTRSPSPIASPTRTRSNTPTPNRNGASNFTQSTSASRSPGMKSKILTSSIPITPGRVRGPMPGEFVTAEAPEADVAPIDPTLDPEVANIEIEQMNFDDQITFEPGESILPHTMTVKQKMMNIGGIVNNIERLDFSSPPKTEPTKMDMAMGGTQVDPGRRPEVRKNLGLFFGHENWNLLMNMMIGFRAGLKM